MELYAGIDLHSNNSVACVLDEQDRTVFAKRPPNDLASIVDVLQVSCPPNFVFQRSMVSIETGRMKSAEDSEAGVHG